MRQTERNGERGSAFIEAVVAAAIVAGVLGVMFESLEAAGARHRAIEARRSALLIARSQMAAIGADIQVSPGEVAGADGPFIWRVRIEPGHGDALSASAVGAPALVTVAVREAAGGPDLVELKSQRLAPAP